MPIPNSVHSTGYDYDIAIIGAGVVGTAVAYELAFYQLKTVLIERENDVSMGTSRANSAIIHAGYDPLPHTLMARLNVAGTARIPELCSRLDVPYKNCGSLVIGFDENDREMLRTLYRRGQDNRVPGLQLLNRDETLQLEPQLAPNICGSLWAPSAGVIVPWQLCLAFAETAVKGGCELLRSTELYAAEGLPGGGFALQLRPTAEFFPDLSGQDREMRVRAVVNAAGVYADLVHNLIAAASFKIRPCRGEYFLLDRDTTGKVEKIIFQCPDQRGKGIVVSQMVPGNILVGPNSHYQDSRSDTSTSREALTEVQVGARRSLPGLQFGDNIRSFAGIRANSTVDDFIIGEARPGWIDAAGIRSPGLSSAPAIATMVVELLQDTLREDFERRDWQPIRKRNRLTELTPSERQELIAREPLYGRIICRCETVSEGEIVAALHSPVPALSLDGVKRRTEAGFGRCQSGFCGPRVLEIISRELGIPATEVILDRPNSKILTDKMAGTPEPYIVRLRMQKGSDSFPGTPRPEQIRADQSSDKAEYDLVVVGGGPAGLAAALAAKRRGLSRILLVERDTELGGILNQCVHNGFGLHFFQEELTGPEYAQRFIERLTGQDIELALDTMVLDIGADRTLQMISRDRGWRQVVGRSIVLAMGCRERTRGPIGIAGTRPAGILTAGTAQRYVNLEGYLVGKRVVVLGSGDIGLIMARRMVLEGAEVLACVEIMPYSSGLTRNLVQCLADFDIPLLLSSTITEIRGQERVEAVVVMSVDENRQPIPGTEQVFEADTVLLSVGLIPENELSKYAGVQLDELTKGPLVFADMETSVPGIFACGNVVQVHDLVDFVTEEAERAGSAAADFVLKSKAAVAESDASDNDAANTGTTGTDALRTDVLSKAEYYEITAGSGLSYIVPQRLRAGSAGTLLCHFRVNRIFDGDYRVQLSVYDRVIASFKRDFMLPGEMEQLRIPEALVRLIDGDVTVRVVSGEQCSGGIVAK
jgi:glycerol-3-phosphate dehydrogenase